MFPLHLLVFFAQPSCVSLSYVTILSYHLSMHMQVACTGRVWRAWYPETRSPTPISANASRSTTIPLRSPQRMTTEGTPSRRWYPHYFPERFSSAPEVPIFSPVGAYFLLYSVLNVITMGVFAHVESSFSTCFTFTTIIVDAPGAWSQQQKLRAADFISYVNPASTVRCANLCHLYNICVIIIWVIYVWYG